MTWQCSWVWGGWCPVVQWGWWDDGGWGGELDDFNEIISIGKKQSKNESEHQYIITRREKLNTTYFQHLTLTILCKI